MSPIDVEIRRALDDTAAQMAVVRVTSSGGGTQAQACPVGLRGETVAFDVPVGLTRVDLCLPNGHREQRTVSLVPGQRASVVFTPPPSPHELLGLHGLVSALSRASVPRPPSVASASHRPRVLERLSEPLELFVDRLRVAVPVAGGDGEVRLQTGEQVLHAEAAADRLRLRITTDRVDRLAWSVDGRRGLVVPVDGSDCVLAISLPPFKQLDVVLSPGEHVGEPGVDAEVVVYGSSVASLLGYLGRGDLESASTLYDSVRDEAERALYGKRRSPGLAIVGAYALLALGRLVPDGPISAAGPAVAELMAWLRNLAAWFPFSDGPILWATAQMQLDPGGAGQWFDEVREALVAGISRPVPMLSRGIDLWLDGLLRVDVLRRALRGRRGDDARAEDPELGCAISRARWYRERLRARETFTTLWIPQADLGRFPW